ncbi:glycosyltransferase [Thalassotalea sp. LPB0316]|uniref:CgeB family protein n=1 Tax=Thalassotalea sp. LPB0316 TaxID=2769490 RepID=UPI0018682F0A|nr:glycosyltransferase [Thalassotalea sp. LPB0316]QOL24417.1 glycosyltransferase [Thalassotalea sp. LPB0316]
MNVNNQTVECEDNQSDLEAELRGLQNENDFLTQRLKELKHSTTYQLSYHINKAGTLRGFLRFPLAFYKVLKQYKQKADAKKAKEQADNALFIEFKGDKHAEQLRIEQVRAKFKQCLASENKLKVASILDEFSFGCFAPECELFQLSAVNIQDQLDEFKPDLIFIESAWQGKNGEWFKKVRHVSKELIEVLRWARANHVPTAFWNKEDPVHFSAFLPIARLVDFVFTTDSRCLERYKEALQHERVSVLPFAAQPRIHNPIEQFERWDKVCFAGSYYKNYPQRQLDFESLFNGVTKLKGIDIYDRNFNVENSQNVFPEKFQKYIKGSLPFDQIAKAYKGYNFGLNMNTIKDSPTMFARRVYELMASNTIVVSNYAKGIEEVFGDLVINSDDANEIADQLRASCNDVSQYRKMRLRALREVMSNHTYFHRVLLLQSLIAGQAIESKIPSVIVVCFASKQEECMSVIEQFSHLSYKNKRLVFIATSHIELEGYNVINIEHGCEQLLSTIQEHDYVAFMSKQDWYGKAYLTDLTLAFQYADISCSGKNARYVNENNHLSLVEEHTQYRPIERLPARSSMIDTKKVSLNWLDQNIQQIEQASFSTDQALAIDEFNYCQHGAEISSVNARDNNIVEAINVE